MNNQRGDNAAWLHSLTFTATLQAALIANKTWNSSETQTLPLSLQSRSSFCSSQWNRGFMSSVLMTFWEDQTLLCAVFWHSHVAHCSFTMLTICFCALCVWCVLIERFPAHCHVNYDSVIHPGKLGPSKSPNSERQMLVFMGVLLSSADIHLCEDSLLCLKSHIWL